MSLRIATRRVLASVAATAAAGTLALVAFAGPAGATGPASGGQVLNAAQPTAPYTAGTPFSSGQSINVVVPANSAFASPNNHAAINVVECSAPNGVIPTNTSACDGNTIQGNTILPNSDGSFSYAGYQVFALPDLNIGDSASGPACGRTSATECILYIGNNQSDFTQPHLWSQPFFVDPGDGTDSGANPGDGTPEVPLAIILPISAMGLLGAAVLIRRRRAAHSA